MSEARSVSSKERFYLVSIDDRYHVVSSHSEIDEAIEAMARHRARSLDPCVIRFGVTGARMSVKKIMQAYFDGYALAVGEDPEKIWRRIAA